MKIYFKKLKKISDSTRLDQIEEKLNHPVPNISEIRAIETRRDKIEAALSRICEFLSKFDEKYQKFTTEYDKNRAGYMDTMQYLSQCLCSQVEAFKPVLTAIK